MEANESATNARNPKQSLAEKKSKKGVCGMANFVSDAGKAVKALSNSGSFSDMLVDTDASVLSFAVRGKSFTLVGEASYPRSSMLLGETGQVCWAKKASFSFFFLRLFAERVCVCVCRRQSKGPWRKF